MLLLLLAGIAVIIIFCYLKLEERKSCEFVTFFFLSVFEEKFARYSGAKQQQQQPQLKQKQKVLENINSIKRKTKQKKLKRIYK